MSLPKFFGLDIGNNSIKIVMIKDQGKSPKMVKYGSIQTPDGAYGNADEASKKKIAEAIKELVDQMKLDTRNVVTAVSERDVFSTKIKFSFQDEKTLDESAYWAISKIMPVPIDTVNYGYLPISVIQDNEKKDMEALVISVEKKISAHYAEIVEMAGLLPLALETEGVALVRSVALSLANDKLQNTLIVDIGSNSTSICIVKGQNLLYSTSIPTGSDVITRSISQSFNLDMVQAEEYKKTYGLNEQVFEGKIANVIKPVMDTILIDINRALQFFRQDQPESSMAAVKLLGETSAMPGLISYMTKYLGITTEVGDPLFGIHVDKNMTENKQTFAVAIGLALKTDL